MNADDFGQVLARLPRRRDELLPALHAVHDAAGWLPEAGILAVSLHTAVPTSELYGIISSYSELRLTPPHEPQVEICTGLSCRMAGADELVRHAAQSETVTCRFLCGVAPVAEVAGRYHGRLTPVRLRAALAAATTGVPA